MFATLSRLYRIQHCCHNTIQATRELTFEEILFSTNVPDTQKDQGLIDKNITIKDSQYIYARKRDNFTSGNTKAKTWRDFETGRASEIIDVHN